MLQLGSMEPEYAVGDILITREKQPSAIKVGDNIVYLGNIADYKGKIITHNVINIEQDENGKYLFHTKGIANTIEDPIVHEEQLYGIVVQNNIVLAWLCKIISNRYGLYFCVMIPLILYMFIGFVKSQEEKIEQEKEEERERKRLKKEKKSKNKNELEESDNNSEENIIKTKSKKTKDVDELKITSAKALAKKTTTTKKAEDADELKITSTKSPAKKTATTKKAEDVNEPKTTNKKGQTKKSVATKSIANAKSSENSEEARTTTKSKKTKKE